METIATRFRASARTTHNLWAVVTTAMLLALNTVLTLFVRIQITPDIRISFGFVAIAMIGMLFGPVMGLTGGVLGDLIGMVVKPTGAYFPGYTLTALLVGLVFGLMLYREDKIGLIRCFITMAIIDLVLHLSLNTLWSVILNGSAFWVILGQRAIKNLLSWPVDSLLLFGMAQVVRRILKQLGKPLYL